MDYRRIRLFQDVADPRIADALSAARRIRLADGERLLEAGQENHHLYLLLDGRMEARLSDDPALDGMPIAAGEAIGEMSILDGRQTSAHVHPVGESLVLAIHGDDFWRRLAPVPGVMRNLTRLVTQRLRLNSERMVRNLEAQLQYEHLKKELAAARDIQMALLPRHVPLFPRHGAVDAHAHLVPAKEVGGDLFEAIPLDDDHILVAVGDVSGKGMPAALFMMRTLTLLRSLCAMPMPRQELLASLNRLLCDNNETNMFVTLTVVVLSTRSGHAMLLNGGHPPPLASFRGGPFQALTEARGALLGVMPGARYRTAELDLSPGDRIVFYSDGVTEAENPAREFFTQDRLQSVLDDIPAAADMAELTAALTRAVAGFAGEADQSDDITILSLRYLGPRESRTGSG